MAQEPEGQESPAIEAPEPWEQWETRLCVGSVVLGVAALAVLGVLVHAYLL